MVVAGETGKTIENGTQQYGRRFHALLLGQLLSIVPHDRSAHTAVLALRTGIGKIRSQLCHFLHFAQSLLEELCSLGKGIVLFCGLLLSNKLMIATHLTFYLLTIHKVADLVYEQIVGITVAYQVMNVAV